MNKKKYIVMLLCLCMLGSTFAGCAKEKTSEPDKSDEGSPKVTEAAAVEETYDPFGKMDPEIAQTGVRIKTSWMTLDEGDDENNNIWSREVKDVLGITLTQNWTASDWGTPFDEKVNLAIATDDMPDIAPLYTTLFFRAVDNGRVSDLTEAYEKYASPRLREYMEMSDSAALKTVTYDGKIMGLASPPSTDEREFLWLRQDWLNKLGLKAPTTMDELYALAEAFATQDPNGNGKADEIGLALSKNFFGGNGDIAKLFWAYGLYPRTWIEKDGQLTRGELLPENKEVLKKLAELYSKGVIAKDFAIKDPLVECDEDIAAGKVGICFGGFSLCAAPALVSAHENTAAEWEAYDMPTTTGKKVVYPAETRIGNFVVAGNKNKNPEAVIKMINLQLEIDNFNPDYVKDNTFNMSPNGSMNFWCKPAFGIDAPNVTTARAKNVYDALYNGLDPASLNVSEKQSYDEVKDYEANKTIANWDTYTCYKKGGAVEKRLTQDYEDAVYLSPAWWPETPAWVQYGQDLHTKVQDYFINAVVSGDVDGEFDKWIEYFNSQGGEDVLKEYNDKYNESK